MIYQPKKDINVFFDVGANNGIVTLWYSIWSPNMTVYAFEPDPEQFALLKKNIKQNHIGKVKLYQFALSNKNSSLKFHVYQDAIYSLNSGLTKNQDLPYKTMTVHTKQLSSFVKNVKGRVSLVSMDIEGEEYNVLEDLLKSEAIKNIDMVIFEGHHFTFLQNTVFKKLCKQLALIGSFTSKKITPFTTLNKWSNNL